MSDVETAYRTPHTSAAPSRRNSEVVATPRTPLLRRRSSRRRPRRASPHVYAYPAVFLFVLLLFAWLSAWDLTTGQCYIGWLCSILGGRQEPYEQVLMRNTGAYAPWISRGGGVLPHGCEVDQVSILHRHTGRYPTPNAGVLLRRTLAKIANRVVRSPTNRPEFSFLFRADMELQDWQFGDLTDHGRWVAWVSGKTYAAEYGLPVFSRTTDNGRVSETARFWLEGFAGLPFNSSLPPPDVIIPEGKNMNNTLSVHSCKTFEKLDPPAGYAHFERIKQLLAPAAERLNSILDPRPALDEDDILAIASMCGFDTSVQASEDRSGWSRWCRVLSRDEWEVVGYVWDVERWYRVGEGGRYGAIMGAGWVNELLARLHDSVPKDSTTTNHTLDNDETTFPRGGNRLFVDFTHDNEMVEILTAMGIKKMREKLPSGHLPPHPKHRRFVLSELIPFGARWAVERISCPASVVHEDDDIPESLKKERLTFVRVLINDKPTQVDHMACRSSPLRSHYMCTLDAFVESQVWAREDVDWTDCLQ